VRLLCQTDLQSALSTLFPAPNLDCVESCHDPAQLHLHHEALVDFIGLRIIKDSQVHRPHGDRSSVSCSRSFSCVCVPQLVLKSLPIKFNSKE
jgi:hypothetical protein